VSSGLLRRVALARTDVWEECIASIIRVAIIAELVRALAVTSSVLRLLVTGNVVPTSPILVTLMIEAIRSFETSALIRVTHRHIPEDDILHSHRREHLKSNIALPGWTL
jgi:hypothetical protein